MITEWLAQTGIGIWTWLLTLLPDWELPPELLGADGVIGALFNFAQGMEPFVDWAFVGIVAAVPLVVWAIGIGWKALRMVISHIPQFGGNG